MRRSSSALFAALCLTLLIPFAARADDPWLIVPTASSESNVSRLLWVSDQVHQTLTRLGIEVWEKSSATDQYESRGSHALETPRRSEINKWKAISERGLRLLNQHKYQEANDALATSLVFVEKNIEYLNRKEYLAKRAFNICLDSVRGLLEVGLENVALRRAQQCRVLSPKRKVAVKRHTPEVIGLLNQIDRNAKENPVTQAGIVSEPAGCKVRMNGTLVGTTPMQTEGLVDGLYGVQVECGEKPGRIQTIYVGSGSKVVQVTERFDLALHSKPTIHLVYENTLDENKYRVRDAKAIAKLVRSARIVLVTMLGQGEARLDLRDQSNSQLRTSVWFALEKGVATRTAIQRAVRALIEERSIDLRSGTRVERTPWRAGALTDPETDPYAYYSKLKQERRRRIIGWTLGGIGAASFVIGGGLKARRNKLSDRFLDDIDDLEGQQDWINARKPLYAMFGIAALSSTAALPLILPKYEKTPWWSWLLGGLGAGLAGYTIYEAASLPAKVPGACSSADAAARACVERTEASDRAVMLGSLSAPLLSAPLVYIIRNRRVKVSVKRTESGAAILWHGTF